MTNPNESANPTFLQNGLTHDCHVDIGLTKREHFAAMAMQGILAQMPNVPWGVEKQARYYTEQYPGFTMFQAAAAESVSMADALIEALNKTK